MPRISKVGNGHALPDYATGDLWWAAESIIDYGSPIEAVCSGDCGSLDADSGSINGYEVYSDGIEYDGTNHESLPLFDRFYLDSENGTARNFRVFQSSIFTGVSLGANNTTAEKFHVSFGAGASSFGLSMLASATNRNARNFVLDCTNSSRAQAVQTGFKRVFDATNYLIFGADIGCPGSAGDQKYINGFSFNNSNIDYESDAELTNAASEDTTGSIGWTGYTSAELVNFAGGDYRTKLVSDLSDDGTGNFIGAFLESGGGSEVNVSDSLSDSVSSVNNDSIAYVGEFSVFDLSNNSAGSVNQDSISFVSTVNISDSISGSLSDSPDDNVYLVGELVVNDSIVDSISRSNQDGVTLAATISVNDSPINSISSAINESIKLSGAFDVIDQLVNSSVNANDDLVAFSSTVSVSDQSSNSQSDSSNDEVSFIGAFSISEQLTNSLSLANVDSISFTGEIILTDGAVNSTSLANSEFIQIGAFNFTVYKETNLSSTFKSRNIDSPSLSTNIDG